MTAVQQATSRKRRGLIGRATSEAGALPPLKAGAAWVAGYRLTADVSTSTGGDATTGVGNRPVTLGAPSVAAARGRDAAASFNGSADGNTEHPNPIERGDKATTTSLTNARRRAGASRVKLEHVSGNSPTVSLLRFDEQRVGARAVLTAVGEVDMSTAADLHRALETAGDAGASEIWLDLTQTTFMDCSGLRVLLNRRASLREASRRLVLICPAGPVLRLLVLTGVDHEFEIHPTRTAAQYAN